MADNSTNEQTQNSERRSAEAVAEENKVSSAVLVRAYRSIGDRSKLLEGLSHIRGKLLAVIQAIDRLREDVERD